MKDNRVVAWSFLGSAWALFASFAMAVAACTAEAPADPPPAEARVESVATVAARMPSGTELSVPELGATLADEGEEEEEDKDYWKDVTFDRTNFDEVLEYVDEHYIDPGIDRSRAYAEACAFAFGSLTEPYMLFPKAFYEQRKGHADEEGDLDGETSTLASLPGMILVRVVEKKEEKRKKLSDEEILALREKGKTRRRLLDETWRALPAMDHVKVDTCVAEAKRIGLADQKAYQKQARSAPKGKKKDAKPEAVSAKDSKDSKDKEQKKHEILTEAELEKRLWLGAAQGYLHALDPHSALVSAKAWEESTRKTTDDSFDGIGAILTKRDDFIVVESPIEGQPAFAAGLRAGDRIIKVDDKSVIGSELQPVVQRIRGKRGTQVVLTIRREGEPEDMNISITRAFIKIQNVTSKFVKDHKDIGYVKLSGFVPSSAEKLREAITDLQKQTSTGKLRGLVLDLRNNSGGLLQQAVEIADMFLKDGVIVTVKDRVDSQHGEKKYQATAKEYLEMPLVVLVSDGSASASEIVAGAVQDNGRGLIVGDRTFGKASVQTLFNPRKGRDYYIKLTVARYYAPSGRTIQVIGITPDFPTPPEVDKPMPLGFREENLNNHLGALETEYDPGNKEIRQAVAACSDKRGIAEKAWQADPNPQIRYDYQLMKAADFLECLADLRAQANAQNR